MSKSVSEISLLSFISSDLVANNSANVNHNQYINGDRLSGLAALYEKEHPDTFIAMSDDDALCVADTSVNIVTKENGTFTCKGDQSDFYNKYAISEIVDWLKTKEQMSTTKIFNELKK